MAENIPTDEEVLAFDANAALLASRKMWMLLGNQLSDIAMNFGDFLDTPAAADEAMRFAMRAEACMWAATGDSEPFDVRALLAASKDTDA